MTLHLICFAALTVPCTDGGRSTCCSVRKWPVVILQRMADLLGTELVQSRLKREITVFSFFSGIDCQKFAWKFLSAACEHLWHFKPAVSFDFSVSWRATL